MAAGVLDIRVRQGPRVGALLYLAGCAGLIQEWETRRPTPPLRSPWGSCCTPLARPSSST